MKLGKILMLMLAAVSAATLFVGCSFYKGYNRAIALDENVQSAWAQVESQLQRRFDLIPNLVKTVKGVAGQEEKIFLGIANARKAYFKAESPAQKARAAGGYQGALSRLLMLQEKYPELKSNESFNKLQDSIEGTENRISTERRRYNDTVKQLNSFSRKLLGSIYASVARVEKAEYFQVSEEATETPKVDFGE